MTKEEMNTAEADCLRCYQQGYEVGKKDAVKMAVQWLDRNLVDSDTFAKMWFIRLFKEAMGRYADENGE